MDHFAAPEGTERIIVPYLCIEEYDDGEFHSYPYRKGWTKAELNGANSFGNRSPLQVEAFFQTWLYFGFLKTVLRVAGIEVTTKDFVEELDNGEKVISTKVFPKVAQAWMDREGITISNSEDVFQERNQQHNQQLNRQEDSANSIYIRGRTIKDVLDTVLLYANKYCNTNAQAYPRALTIPYSFWPISPKVSLSILAIGESLTALTYEFYGFSRYQHPSWGSSQFLNERLLSVGWCPREIPIHHGGTNVCTDYYYGGILSPRRHLDHSRCTSSVCCAKNMESDEIAGYDTKHVTQECKCQHVMTPDAVTEIIRGGGIPVVAWRQDGDDADYELKVAKYEPHTKMEYVAISHVWSDGMGNEKQNSLPRCQLTRLQSMVDQTYPRNQGGRQMKTVGFWMDTLCVPVGEGNKELRRSTIRQMAEIYTQARRSLILDSYIQKVSCSDNVRERRMHLWLSNWHRRLWTMQEGLLPREKYFQFKDGSISLARLQEERPEKTIQSLYRGFPDTGFGDFVPFYDLLYFDDEDPSSASELASLSNTEELHRDKSYKPKASKIRELFGTFTLHIRDRSTSKPSDESICFSTLLGLDPAPLFPLDGEERMEEFYRQVETYDRDFIFNNFPRLSKKGYRWAPRSFLGMSKDPFFFIEPDAPVATINPEGGLNVVYMGFKFTIAAPCSGPELLFLISDDPDSWYSLRLLADDDGNDLPVWELGVKYAVVYHGELGGHDPPLTQLHALLGIYEGEKSGAIQFSYVCRAEIIILDQELLADAKEEWTHLNDILKKEGSDESLGDRKRSEGELKAVPVIAECTGGQQLWCIL